MYMRWIMGPSYSICNPKVKVSLRSISVAELKRESQVDEEIEFKIKAESEPITKSTYSILCVCTVSEV